MYLDRSPDRTGGSSGPPAIFFTVLIPLLWKIYTQNDKHLFVKLKSSLATFDLKYTKEISENTKEKLSPRVFLFLPLKIVSGIL